MFVVSFSLCNRRPIGREALWLDHQATKTVDAALLATVQISSTVWSSCVPKMQESGFGAKVHRNVGRAAAHTTQNLAQHQHLLEAISLLTCSHLVAIPVPSLGTLYNSIGRHSCKVTGCTMTRCSGVTRLEGRETYAVV